MPASRRRRGIGSDANEGCALPAPASLSYEQARDELLAVVQRLEAGGEPLETSLALWERGGGSGLRG